MAHEGYQGGRLRRDRETGGGNTPLFGRSSLRVCEQPTTPSDAAASPVCVTGASGAAADRANVRARGRVNQRGLRSQHRVTSPADLGYAPQRRDGWPKRRLRESHRRVLGLAAMVRKSTYVIWAKLPCAAPPCCWGAGAGVEVSPPAGVTAAKL